MNEYTILINRYLRCFQFLPLTNNVIIKILVLASWYTCVCISVGYIHRTKMAVS